ncbi:MAG: hypothetical protein ACXU68_05805 [Croceibacterium sp.]
MSIQFETAFQVLIQLYIEFDQRTGWTTEGKIVQYFKGRGVGQGRVEDAIAILRSLKMLDQRVEDDKQQVKISSYGVQWLEKTCPPMSTGDSYEFALPTFRSIRLVGPDEFYGRRQRKDAGSHAGVNWTKLGAIAAIVAIPVPFIVWWLT